MAPKKAPTAPTDEQLDPTAPVEGDNTPTPEDAAPAAEQPKADPAPKGKPFIVNRDFWNRTVHLAGLTIKISADGTFDPAHRSKLEPFFPIRIAQ